MSAAKAREFLSEAQRHAKLGGEYRSRRLAAAEVEAILDHADAIREINQTIRDVFDLPPVTTDPSRESHATPDRPPPLHNPTTPSI